MPEPRFRKGDLVQFYFVNRTIRGIVKEDRGPIGFEGRRLYAVEFRVEPVAESLSIIELPAEELQAVEGAASLD